MSVGDEDKPTKWLQREGQNMLPITIIQEPLDVLFLGINFQQRKCLMMILGSTKSWPLYSVDT